MDQDGARLSDQDIVGSRTIVGAVVIQELREPVDLDGVLLDAGGNLVVRLLLRAAPVLEHAVVGPVSAFACGNPGSNGGLHFAQAVVPLRQPRSIYVAVAPASKVHLAEVKRAGVLQDLFVVQRLWSQPLHVTAGKGMKSDVRAKNRDTGSFRCWESLAEAPRWRRSRNTTRNSHRRAICCDVNDVSQVQGPWHGLHRRDTLRCLVDNLKSVLTSPDICDHINLKRNPPHP